MTMNDYQQEVANTLELLFTAAQKNSGRVLDKVAVRHVCTYIQNMLRALEFKDTLLMGADTMIAAYVNEYGSELYETLMADEGEVVDGEVESETSGRDDESVRMDSQEEE